MSNSSMAVVGDIGGTNFRLALSTDEGLKNIQEHTYERNDTPADLITTYIKSCDQPERITHAVFAVASPSSDPANVVFTNGAWKQKPVSFAIDGLETTVLNDFAAITYSIRSLKPEDCRFIAYGAEPFFPSVIFDQQETAPVPTRILESDPAHRFAVIGPGTGLGVSSGLVTKSGQFLVMDGEGGHGSFAPDNEEELAVKHYLEKEQDVEVTKETIASGTGLPLVFNAYAKVIDKPYSVTNAAQISELARSGGYNEKQCARWVLDLFAKTLGSCASSTVLTTNARTLFIAGGVVPRLGTLFRQSTFIDAFHQNDLGANNITEDVPVMLIRHPQPGLLGAHSYFRLSQP